MRPILFIMALVGSTPVLATTYHVSNSGADTNDGLSLTTAWATIQRAVAASVAGDSVVVHAGSYQGFSVMAHSGTASAPIVITTAGGAVNINAPCAYNGQDGINVENVDWVVIEGFIVEGMPRAGIRTALSTYVTIRGNQCRDNYRWGIFTGFAEHVTIEHNVCTGSEDEHGIYVSNSADHPIIRFNECAGNNACGIHMNGDVSLGGDGVISYAQVYGNTIHGNGAGGGSGINGDGVVGALIHNNLLFDNRASGISLFQIDGGAPSTGNRVYNNTVVNAANARWCLNITSGCTGNEIINNVLINQHAWRGSISIAQDALPGTVSGSNIVTPRFTVNDGSSVITLAAWQQLVNDVGSQVADPLEELFVAPGTDHHPLGATAQTVDAGSNGVAAYVTMDLVGTPRPQGGAFDVGCFEYVGTTGVERSSETRTIHIADGLLELPDTDGLARVAMYDLGGRCIFEEGVRGPRERPAVPQYGGLVLVVVSDATGMVRLKERLFLP